MLFLTEKISSRIRGELTKWMLQLKPGVFIGTLSTLVGEKLWLKIQKKQGRGGAIWVKTMNNEQKYILQITGNTTQKVTDFDGLQLITHPLKQSKSREKPIPKLGEKKKHRLKPKRSEITWDIENTPNNCITRTVLIKMAHSTIESSFFGTSAYWEYPPEKLWESSYREDILNMTTSLFSTLSKITNLKNTLLYNKKLLSLDIETTDYLPKAYEGFINVIGITILDLRENSPEFFSLCVFQVFNMLRKKSIVPRLIQLIKPYFKDVDCMLVFNQKFDIQILQTVINEFSIDFSFPSHIIDLQKQFSKLKELETFLDSQVGVKRLTTSKDDFLEYYRLFKGKEKEGFQKQIEPLGTYNVSDTLTPLYAYILLHSHDINHEKMVNCINNKISKKNSINKNEA